MSRDKTTEIEQLPEKILLGQQENEADKFWLGDAVYKLAQIKHCNALNIIRIFHCKERDG